MTHHTSTQLEHEADESRERVSSLLDELRGRASPGEVVDQVYDYARNGAGGDFVRSFGTQVRNNPLAVALVGAGIGWLMFSERSSGRSEELSYSDYESDDEEGSEGAADRVRGAYHDASDGVRRAYGATASGMSAAGSSARSMASRASGAVTGAAGSVRDSASEASQSMADGATAARDRVADLAARGRDGASRMARTGSHYAEQLTEHPMVLAGLGLAIGAAIGAMFPSTEREDRLMGGASDDLKDKAMEFGHEQYDKAETVVERTADQAMTAAEEAADEVGLVPPQGGNGREAGGTEAARQTARSADDRD